MFITLNDEGYIGAITDKEEFSEGMTEFIFPDDFDFTRYEEYRVVDGELVHDPKQPSEEQIQNEHDQKVQEQIALAIPMMVQANSASIPDAQAVQIPLLFREWKVGDSYTRNEIIRHEGELYRIGQDHTSQAQWVPGAVGVTALYSQTALYSHIEIGEDNYEVWKPWDGVSGIYKQDQIVHDPEDNNNLYISLIPNNTWGPPHSFPSLWELYDD